MNKIINEFILWLPICLIVGIGVHFISIPVGLAGTDINSLTPGTKALILALDVTNLIGVITWTIIALFMTGVMLLVNKGKAK